MPQETKWSILLRGDSEVVEVVLRDIRGWRASKQCTDGAQVINLLCGWELFYSCPARLLFILALQGVRSTVADTLHDWADCLIGGQRFRLLSPDAVMNMMELARYPYRPRDIRDLKREIESDIRDAERHTECTGMIDYGQVDDIVAKRFQLDALYGAWAEGRIN
ncbi:MAG: hypothetical protein RDU25_03110 [Patescibacteria group bacterium]|nr:hypothetical protein [Patescibacteria group bacterium]